LRVRATARLARSISVAGERSKDDVARSVHAVRLALREVARRAGLDPETSALYSWPELRSAARGERLDIDLAGRRDELDAAAANPPPLFLRTDDVPLPRFPVSDPTRTLVGVGASAGQANGRAVVVTDPLQAISDGEILVAHSTDTAWTHLFLTHTAVVTDVGDLLSHSSIVARDLGIPAVVGTRTATTLIRNGDHTHVDGDTGTVSLT
jgi:phosphohistidine swiveling domain-containing protein